MQIQIAIEPKCRPVWEPDESKPVDEWNIVGYTHSYEACIAIGAEWGPERLLRAEFVGPQGINEATFVKLLEAALDGVKAQAIKLRPQMPSPHHLCNS